MTECKNAFLDHEDASNDSRFKDARQMGAVNDAEGGADEADAFYRTLFEQSPAGILIIDTVTSLPARFNETACRQLGYTREEFSRMRIFDHDAAESSEETKTRINGIFKAGQGSFETKHRAKNGETRDVLVTIKKTELHGKPFFYAVFRDITDVRRAEEENRMKANLLDAAIDSILLNDFDGNFVYANRAAHMSRGYSKEELMGLNLRDVVRPRTPDFVDSWIKKLAEKGQMTFESTHVRKDGSVFPVEVDASIAESNGKRLILTVSRDITERKLAEEKLAQEMDITSQMLMVSEATAHTMDIGKLMKDVVSCVSKIIGSDICVSYLWDAELKVFRPAEAMGLAHDLDVLFRSESVNADSPIVNKAFGLRGAVVEKVSAGGEDAFIKGPSFLRLIEGRDTSVTIPLTGKTGDLGFIASVFLKSNPKSSTGLTERDRTIIRGIGVQVRTALEEARLYKESIDRTMKLSNKMETIRVMHEIDRSILSNLDPGKILETAVNMLARVIPCDRATVALADRERGGLVYEAGFGLDFIPKGAFIAFDETNTTDVVTTGRPQYMSDLREISSPLPFERGLMRDGFLSQIRVPLAVKGEVVGVLSMGKRRPAGFVPEDLATLEKLAYQISLALENARLVQDLESLFLGIVRTLSRAIDAKSPWTYGHSERVTRIALEIGGKMGLGEKEMKDLELAGLLHDIGKLGTYESVLNKEDALTKEEHDLIKEHTAKGAEIVEPIKQLRDIMPIIKHHHESYDGRGYPEGLRGREIPFLARILSLADAVDAMSADRPYRKGKPMEEIIEELKRCSSSQFDPEVVRAYLSGAGSSPAYSRT